MTMIWALSKAGGVLAGIAILIMMIIGAADVIGLLFFAYPMPGAFEFTESLLVATVFLALALAQARRQHVRVEIFLNLMPHGLRRGVEMIGHLFTAGIFAIICWVSWLVALGSIQIGEFSSGIIQFPVWPARTALALGATLMTLQALADMAIAAGLARRPGDPSWTR